MTTYFFENITDAQAATFTSTDTLVFNQAGESAGTTTLYFLNEATGAATLISGLTGKAVNLGSFAGQTPIFPDGSIFAIGTAGADTQLGSAGTDKLFGGAGDDSLQGNAGADALSGGSGADTLSGGIGGDTLTGGDGADWFRFAAGDSGVTLAQLDVIKDWGGSDRLALTVNTVSASNYLEGVGPNYATALNAGGTILATGATDVLAVSVGTDVYIFVDSTNTNTIGDAFVLSLRTLDDIDLSNFVALGAPPPNPSATTSGTAGADTLMGLAGADCLSGLEGADSISGGSGADTLLGQDDNDIVLGDAGSDSIDGGAGNDNLSGGADNDLLHAGQGDDSLVGDLGNDTLHGQDGNDVLTGGGGGDDLLGGAGADTFAFASGSSGVVLGYMDRIADWQSNDILSFGYGASAISYMEATAPDYASALSLANFHIANQSINFVAVQIGSDVAVFADTAGNNGAAEDVVVLVGRTLADVSYVNFGGAAPPVVPVEGGVGPDTLVGSTGPDTINGYAGSDDLTGHDGDDSIAGGDGNDSLSGQNGKDTLGGGSGADNLNGGPGADSLSDGAGTNTFTGGAGADTISASTGQVDRIVTGSGESGVTAGAIDVVDNWGVEDFLDFGSAPQITATNYVETSAATYQAALAYAHAQIAGGGVDYVVVAIGADLVVFGDSAGNNILADDAILLRGVGLADFGPTNLMSLGTGPGEPPAANQVIVGTNASEILIGGTGDDSISAGGGEDEIQSLSGADTVDGGAGHDAIQGRGGDDRLDGGDGVDTLSYLNAAAGVTVNLAVATVQNVAAGEGTDTQSGFERLDGSLFSDSLTGDTQDNLIRGWSGDDSLAGADGADTLDGREGDDDLTGGAGNDSLMGGGGRDDVYMGAGVDTYWVGIATSGVIQASLDTIWDWSSQDQLRFGYLTGDYAETTAANYGAAQAAADALISGGARYVAVEVSGSVVVFADTAGDGGVAEDAVQLAGGTLADISVANLGSLYASATLPPPPPPPPPPPSSGGGGGGGGGGSGGEIFPAPQELGTGGDDVRELLGGQFSYDGGGGNDMITAGAADNLLYGGDGDDTVSAGAGAGSDTVVGGAGRSYLRGDEGEDRMIGGAGFDDINGNMGEDTINGGDGDDWVVGGKDADVIFGDQGQDLVYGNIGNDVVSGGADDDIVRGGQGNDICRGGDGADYVSGDRGSDTMDGGAGADILHTFSEAGLDYVVNFSVSEGDRVQVDPGTIYTVAQVGGDVVIDMGGGNQMILQNVELSSLPAGWIFGA